MRKTLVYLTSAASLASGLTLALTAVPAAAKTSINRRYVVPVQWVDDDARRREEWRREQWRREHDPRSRDRGYYRGYYAGHADGRHDHARWCAAHHPGYDWRSNTYVDRWGRRRACD